MENDDEKCTHVCVCVYARMREISGGQTSCTDRRYDLLVNVPSFLTCHSQVCSGMHADAPLFTFVRVNIGS